MGHPHVRALRGHGGNPLYSLGRASPLSHRRPPSLPARLPALRVTIGASVRNGGSGSRGLVQGLPIRLVSFARNRHLGDETHQSKVTDDHDA